MRQAAMDCEQRPVDFARDTILKRIAELKEGGNRKVIPPQFKHSDMLESDSSTIMADCIEKFGD